MSFWGIPVSLNQQPTDPINTDVSTTDTIHRMIALAKDSANSPIVSSVVDSLLQSLPSNPSKRELVRAIYWWIKQHVTFEEDETILNQVLGFSDVHQELLISPVVLLQMPRPMGDCDDFSTLCASLLVVAQVPCAFVTIAVDRDEPFRFSHVYVAAYLSDEDRWVAMDCSHGSGLGWEYKGEIFRKVVWKI